MPEEKSKQNEDIFFRQNYEFLVQYNINSQILKILREHFKVREVLVIEEKDEKVGV